MPRQSLQPGFHSEFLHDSVLPVWVEVASSFAT